MSALEKQIHKKHFKNARVILFSYDKSFDRVGVDLLKELREKYKPKKGSVNKKNLINKLKILKKDFMFERDDYNAGMRQGVDSVILLLKELPCEEV